ncbi:hypothetical protein THTE_0518 [Thermogutta terrifontis]|uniref:Uncharacterized protein n=1 Tax=Thermogutta terrifontis TaxID=1331910 RepID=A0A286RAY3_9BACT|nr:hypothetical protein THTE_0518 [Thermogutta terrifontis]
MLREAARLGNRKFPHRPISARVATVDFLVGRDDQAVFWITRS